jgi:3-mercaptopyruvate sulfurtransferase SseA
MDRGFHLVRPLAGGLDAWVAAGYEIEERRAAVREAAGEEA